MKTLKSTECAPIYRLRYAIALHNDHTNPCAFRTDFEHTIHRKAARKIYKWLQKRYGWTETDSGRLIEL